MSGRKGIRSGNQEGLPESLPLEAKLKIKSLQSVYNSKTRALMRSIDELRKQVKTLEASAKESRRTAMIQTLRSEKREQELVVDVLKQELANSAGMTEDDVDQLIIRKTLGGPKRFRPKSREELTVEIRKLNSQLSRSSRRRSIEMEELQKQHSLTKLEKEAKTTENQYGSKELLLSKPQEERIQSLEVELAASEKKQKMYKEKVREMEDEVAGLERQVEKMGRFSEKYSKTRELLEQQQDKHFDLDKRIEELNGDNDRLVTEVEELQLKLKHKERCLDQHQLESTSIKRSSSLREEALKDQLNKLQEDYSKSSQRTIATQNAALDEARQLGEDLTRKLQELEERYHHAVEESSQLKAKSMEQLSQIKSLQVSHRQEVVELTKELAQVKREMDNLYSENNSLRVENESMKKDQEKAFDADSGDEAIAPEDSESEEDSVLENNLQVENEALQRKFAELEAKHLALKKKLEGEDHYVELQQALVETRSQLGLHELAMRKCKSYINRLEKENTNLVHTEVTGKLKFTETQEIALKAVSEQLMGHVSLLKSQLQKAMVEPPNLPTLSEMLAEALTRGKAILVEEKVQEEGFRAFQGEGDCKAAPSDQTTEIESDDRDTNKSTSSSSSDSGTETTSSYGVPRNSSEESEDDDSIIHDTKKGE